MNLGAVNKILKQKGETGKIEVNRKEKCGREIRKTARNKETFS